MEHSRRQLLAALGSVALAGCAGNGGGATPTETDLPATGTGDGSGYIATETSTASPPTAEQTLPLPMEPSALREQAVSGGPSKDGIPSIDSPEFIAASEAPSGLKPGDPVFGVVMDGIAKAYPQEILAQHEICNDTVGDTPVSVTYCPLTGTAMGFFRGGTTFGVSGRLVNNNLIMYDRATETWWPQVLSTAIPGPWNPEPEVESLQQFPVVWTTWERWKAAHPETRLLSRNTGYARNYDNDPYGSYNPREGYYAKDASPMFPALNEDDRLPPKAVVIGARTPEGATAFKKTLLEEVKLAEGKLGETPVLGVYDQELATGYIYLNPEEQSFEYRDGEVADADGEQYAPAELPLERLQAFDAMWFAWAGFYPETSLYV